MSSPRSFQNAIKWAYASNWGEKAFSALFTFVLAALMGPRDFGIISMALIYISFLQMFIDQGLATALIQKKDLDQDHLDSVFWMDLGLSLLLVILSIGFSRWWAKVNHVPEIASIIVVLSLCIPIEGLTIVQGALLKREMDFKSLSIRANASVIVSGIVGLIMAYAGFRVWALVAQQIVRDLMGLVLLWKFSPWRPRLRFSIRHMKDLAGFSISNFIAQLGIFADMQTGSVLLGMLFGPVAVGLYRLADRLMNTVLVTATSSIQSVSLPEFSRHQHDALELRKSALTCIRLSSTATLPAMAGLAAVSDPLMATIGARWTPAADALKVLCVLGMALVFVYFTGPLLQALAKTRQLAILEWARTVVGIAFLVAAGLLVRNGPITWQIMGISVARLASGAFIVAPVFLYILMKLCDISLLELGAAIVPSVVASAAVVASVSIFRLSSHLAATRPTMLLAAEAVVGGLVGLAVLLGLDTEIRMKIFGMIRRSIEARAAVAI